MKTRTKIINKTIKLTNAELEALNCNNEIEMNPGTSREVLNKYFKKLNNDEERLLFYLSWKISDKEFIELFEKLKSQDKVAKVLNWDKSMVSAKLFAINKYSEYEKEEERHM